MSSVIAVIFDFDDRLVPDSTSLLLESVGIDPTHFWTTQTKALYEQGYDQTTAYLNLLLDRVGDGKPLGRLTNARLREFGASLDGRFFPGLPGLSDDDLGIMIRSAVATMVGDIVARRASSI